MNPLNPESVESFRSEIARRLGLYFDESKMDFMADVLRQRMTVCGSGTADAYLQALSGSLGRGELGRLAEALTVTETYFFRNADHFRVLLETVLPERLALQTGPPRLRILSAGSASGEEAYSIAMAMGFHFPGSSAWDVRIRGVDMNPAMLVKAKEGLYSAWALREAPSWAMDRHFTREGAAFRLSRDILSSVEFEERNLSEANDDLWVPGSFDVIFFRNVLMYFVPDVAARVVSRMADALAPGGYLFLGHAETLRGLSNAFHLRHTHGTFYYQRPGNERDRPSPGRMGGTDAPRLNDTSGIGMLLEPSVAWVEVIQKASERIAGLEARSRSSIPPDSKPHPPRTVPALDLGDTLDLLRRERFAEAMDALHRLPPDSAHDPDALLLRAVLLTNMGRLSEAEKVCERLLSSDELNAGAHYLTALCREHAGDLAAAEEHDQTAIYLDASFAMPWLHRGLLSKRRGNPDVAFRHLEHALALLTKEDSSRILMFGGGFGREALIQLCRGEIRNREGHG